MRYRVLLAAIALLLAVSACGGSGSSSSGEKSVSGVRATLRTYLEDIKNGRGVDACDLMTTAARIKVGTGNASLCAQHVVLARRLLSQKTLAGLEAKIPQLKITINGDHATTPSLIGSGPDTKLLYSGGRWLLEAAN